MSDILDAIIDQSFQDQRGRYYFLFDCAEYGDQLKVLKFSVEEHVSKPFKIKLQLTTREKVDPRKLNDRFARLTIVDKHQPEKRHYCGIVSKAVQKDKGFDGGFTRFNVTIRPELHFAKMIHDNRIYQNQTIKEIVEQVLKESGVTRFRWHLLEPHDQREYVVQYKRSNLQFIERLLASEGVSYRFDHKEDGVELVMFDKPVEVEDCDNAVELDYNSTAGAEVRGQSIKRFAWTEAVTTNVATYREQHFKNPQAMYEQKWGTRVDNGQQRVLEKYSFPGYYKSDEAGKRAARYEADALQADSSTGHGMGHAQFLSAGRRFKMLNHDEKRFNTFYFLVSVNQQGRQPNVEEEFASEEDSTFLKTEFTCVRYTTPWRPKRPETQHSDGDHLATVVGPKGEEIHCDEFGRIKIFYNWDRRDTLDDSASCWVRVSQNWAGGQYGGMMIPRVGQSVVVSYINGDIEQPLVTGRIFNSVEQVPYPLPEHKTKTVIRSQTHKGKGFNELSFHDEKSEEKIYLHGQKDYEIHVENDHAKRIDQNQAESIGMNKSIEVGNNHHEVIGGNMTLMVGPNKLQSLVTSAFQAFSGKIGDLVGKLGVPELLNLGEGNLVIGVGKNKSETVMVTSSEIVGGAKTTTVGGGYQLFVQGIKNESVLLGAYEEIGQNKTIVVGKCLEIVCGKARIMLDADGDLTLDGITLKIGGKSIALNANKISLN